MHYLIDLWAILNIQLLEYDETVLYHEKKQVVCELSFSGHSGHFTEKRLPWCSFLLKLMRHVLLLKYTLMWITNFKLRFY